MAWLPLGEAVDRVLARLADQRNGKAGGIDAPREVAREGRKRPARPKEEQRTAARPGSTPR